MDSEKAIDSKSARKISVNSLWVGDRLSVMELLCIASHLAQGHEFNLWTYEEIENVPVGVRLRDGNEILPNSEIFAYYKGKGKGSFSAFSNIFRYKLLQDLGGWWIDMDLVALDRFDFQATSVFALERTRCGHTQIATCAIRLSPNSEIAKSCFLESMEYDRRTLCWGQIGPKLFSRVVMSRHDSIQFFQHPDVFCPVDWFVAQQDPPMHHAVELSGSKAIHLWNEVWRRCKLDKSAAFPRHTLYELLKQRFLTEEFDEAVSRASAASRQGNRLIRNRWQFTNFKSIWHRLTV
jgi:hypothetical protein